MLSHSSLNFAPLNTYGRRACVYSRAVAARLPDPWGRPALRAGGNAQDQLSGRRRPGLRCSLQVRHRVGVSAPGPRGLVPQPSSPFRPESRNSPERSARFTPGSRKQSVWCTQFRRATFPAGKARQPTVFHALITRTTAGAYWCGRT